MLADSIYWYNGDPNGRFGFESSSSYTGISMVYDNFSIVDSPQKVTAVFGNFVAETGLYPVSADWEIRTGMINLGNGFGDAGTLVAAGSSNSPIWTSTEFGFGLPQNRFNVKAGGLSFLLGPGDYWLGLRVVPNFFGPALNPNFRIVNTDGANSIGSPSVKDQNAFQAITFGNLSFLTTVGFDLSLGLEVADTNEVPEPAAMWMAGAGLGVLAIRRRR